MFDIDSDKNGVGSVFFQEFVDFDIVELELGACNIPTDNFFSGIDLVSKKLNIYIDGGILEYLSVHFIHILMIDVIQEPDSRFLRVFFKRNSITIGDIKGSLIPFTCRNKMRKRGF